MVAIRWRGLVGGQEAALGPGDQRHDPEAGASGRHRFHHVVAGGAGRTFARHARDRMREVAEIAKRAALDEIEKRVVRKLVRQLHAADLMPGPSGSGGIACPRRLRPIISSNSPGSQSVV